MIGDSFVNWSNSFDFHHKVQLMIQRRGQLIKIGPTGNLNKAFYIPGARVMEEGHKEQLVNPLFKGRPVYFIALQDRGEESDEFIPGLR